MSNTEWPDVSEVRTDDGLDFLVESAQTAFGWQPPADKLTAALSDAAARSKASEALTAIAGSPSNELAGSTEVRLGKYHIKLRKLLRSAACSVFFLGVSTVDATKLTLLPALEQGVEFLIAFREVLEKLTPTEILLFDIIAELEAKNLMPSIDPNRRRGTRDDILAVLADRGFSKPLDFDIAIDGLISKNAIKPQKGHHENYFATVH